MDVSPEVDLPNLDTASFHDLLPAANTQTTPHSCESLNIFISSEAPAFSGIQAYLAPLAANNPQLVKLVSHVFNESFGYRPDGRPYRLGPKSITERLKETNYLFVAGDERFGIGYLFGKEISSSQGRIAWIESMAVLPLYRRQGVATSMVRCFYDVTKGSARLGCATPNPIAALVVSKVVSGRLFIGHCSPPSHLIRLLGEIRQYCFDLRGCLINEQNLTIKTGFSPLSRSDRRDWSPRSPQEPPQWWTWVQNLPNEFEALLIIEP